MKKIKLKRIKKISFLNYIMLLILFIIITLIFVFKFIGNNLNPKIENYATKQAKRITSLVVSASVTEETLKDFDSNSLFKTTQDSDNFVDFNSEVINKLLIEVTKNTKKYLNDLENGKIKNINLSDTSLFTTDPKKLKKGIIYEVPTGIIFNNALIANIGPKIPVKLDFIGDVEVDVKTDLKDYGINNAIVSISLKIIINEQVIMPYMTKQIKVESNVPIAIKIIQGNIPNYYFNGKTPILSATD